MATKRKRNSSWEFVVRRKELLPRPLYLTFASEEEGDQYVRKLEALLDRGVVRTSSAGNGVNLLRLKMRPESISPSRACPPRTNAAWL